MVNTSRYDTADGGPETLQRFLIASESDTINQRSYSTKLLPELLQTHDYARAFFDRCSAVMGMDCRASDFVAGPVVCGPDQ
ncbi:hypothetical protein BOX37_26225 [Nocardia mangyaensis]|uniref:DUF5753 domain-containing protein n=1 Tax=Nocardia mangyaensis TaxID=2213200 RepID=A0A1J0VXU1_9NOCA|nr:Scr1 family TA system antitoxin-like transcriptional regulator [Nocardia mangyaensis]APE36846.1 hypothetical protein BOX37_26225 [Nocardia mangyaensis]